MIVQTTILCIVAGKHCLLHALSYKPLLDVHAGGLLMWYAAKVTACQQCTSVQPATHIANCTDNAPWHLLMLLAVNKDPHYWYWTSSATAASGRATGQQQLSFATFVIPHTQPKQQAALRV